MDKSAFQQVIEEALAKKVPFLNLHNSLRRNSSKLGDHIN